MKKLKVVILARGGSKSIPKKNIADLCGTPLIGWSILAAKKCHMISDIYVSTDDEEIKDVSLSFGVNVIDRPSEICQDNSTDIDAFKHVVNELNSKEDIVHLRATTPTVRSNILSKAIELFNQNNKCTSLRSAHETPESAYKFFKRDGCYWSGLFGDLDGEYYNLPRQKLTTTFHPNGYIDIVRPKVFMSGNSLHGNKMLSFTTEYVIEVDNQDNLDILRILQKEKCSKELLYPYSSEANKSHT